MIELLKDKNNSIALIGASTNKNKFGYKTLMAYLETIRHSMKLFSLQTDTKNILLAHEKVKSEVNKFIDSFDEVTKRLDQTVDSFEKLKTTRKNKLEKSFDELNQVNKNSEG